MDDNYGRRKIFAEALNKSLGIIVSESGSDIGTVLTHGLRPIADAAAVDQLVVYRVLGAGNERRFGQVYRWAKEDGGTTKVVRELKVVPDHPAVAKWIETCSGGNCVNIHIGIASDAEAAFLTRYGVKSILLSPVHIKGELWGGVAFQDHTSERCFDDTSVEFLSSSARICVNAFIIDETAKALKRSNDLTNVLNKMSEIFLMQSGKTFEEMMSEGGKLLADLVEVDRFSLFRNTLEDGVLYMSQVYRWERVFGGTTKLNGKFAHLAYGQVAPEWERIYKKRKSLSGPVRFLPELEQDIFNKLGARSVFAAPIHINGDPWGFVLLEDKKKERVFDDDLAETIQSAAFLFANAVLLSNIKKMEEEALKAEQTRVLIDSTPLSCTLLDKDGNILTCNKSAVEFFGLSKKEEIQLMFVDLVPECQPNGRNSKEAAIEALRKAYDVGYVFIPDWVHRTLAGEPLPCEVTLERVEYGGNYVIAGYARDLRKRIKAEAKAMDADARAQIMFDTAPFASFMFDKNNNVLDCNQEIVKLFEIPDKEFYSKNFGTFSTEYQPCGRLSSEMALDCNRIALEQGCHRFEWMCRKLNGGLVPTEVTLLRVNYKDEYAIAGYMKDLTEQKAAEQLAKEVMEKTSTLTAILDTTPDLIFCKDLDSRYTLCNKAFEDLINIPREDIIGKDDAEGLKTPPEIAAAFLAEDKRILNEKQVIMFEDYLMSHDGTRILFETIKSPLIIDGKITGIVGIARNITQRKEMARQQAEAEAANRAKSSFLATMSHEMRTPMNAIIGMTAIGKNSKDTERKDYALRKIEEAAIHLLSVINDVLDLSKIEANKLEMAPIEFNFERMLQKIISIINFRMDERHQKFTLNVDKNLPHFIVSDDHRLSQVILNLLSNAVKFSPENGEIGLAVSLAGEKDGICEIRTEVSDNGIGIPPEQQAKLFRAFQQADSGITREFGGTGLGLSISKHIVELMGGKIWVESGFGKGSRFIFTVKVERGKKDVDSVPDGINEDPGLSDTVNEEGAGVMFGRFAGKKMLVAEDVEINREIIISLLEDTGLIIDCAENGMDAVEMTAAAPDKYDIILMDVQMPRMDGLEATRLIRTLTTLRLKNLPIIAMTAHVFKSDIEECLKAGMDDHIGKPIDIEDVMKKLNKYLYASNRSRE